MGLGAYSRFFSAYYLFNTAVVLSYPFFSLWARNEFPNAYFTLAAWEQQSATTLAIVLVVKFFRKVTIDGWIADVYMYSKSAIILLAYFMDYRVLSWYIIFYVLLFLFVHQPVYDGPSKLEYLNPASFAQRVTRESKDDGTVWLVEFYASWSPPCTHLEPTFAELSNRYTTSQLKFGKFDLGRWPQSAEDHRINLSGTSKQLPTLIMFEKGQEIARIPHVYSDGSVAKGRYRRADIVNGFELDMRYARTKLKDDIDAKKNDKKKGGGGGAADGGEGEDAGKGAGGEAKKSK